MRKYVNKISILAFILKSATIQQCENECINVNTKEEIILKKLVSLLEAILLMVMAFPLTALAGQEGTQIISPVF